MILSNINWSVFTSQEREVLQKVIDAGDYANLVSALEGVGTMDREKEIEIQRMVDQMKPVDDDFISEVADEVENKFLQDNPTNHTPEIEKQWQEKLDKEKEEYMMKEEIKREEVTESLELPEEIKNDEIIINNEDDASDKTDADSDK